MSVTTRKMPGQIPPFWDRSVIFFANILSLFYGNVHETEVLKKEVGALETYGSRLLPLVNLMFHGPNNILVLEVPPDNQLIDYFVNDLQLTLPEIQVLPHDTYKIFNDVKDVYPANAQAVIDQLKQYPIDWMDGYVIDKALVNLAECLGKRTIGSNEGSRNGNNKLLLHNFLKTTELNVFDSYEVGSFEEIQNSLTDLKGRGFSFAVVKAPIGASGVGMFKVDLNKGLADAQLPDYLFYEGHVLVQGWLDETVEGVKYIGSPSVQIFVDDENVYLYDLTDQILSIDSIHEGNIAPPGFISNGHDCSDEIFKQAQVASEWLHKQGYRGTGSIDFQVITRDNQLEIRICEINARVTGATYPALLARTFRPSGAWLMRNIRFEPSHDTDNLLNILDRSKLLFRPGLNEGILPFNFNPNNKGEIVKGQFLFLADNVNGVYSLVKRMQELDSIKGVYDRD